MATISQVAEAAGVSTSTVSRVFCAPDQVNAQTLQQVQAVATRLGYVPRATRPSKPAGAGSIGLIVPDIANPHFPMVIKAVQRRARSKNYAVYLADTDASPSDEEEAAFTMSKQVDGLILWSSRLPEDELREIASRVPTVLTNREVAGLSTIVTPSEDGISQAVDHLYAFGHSRCCYINGPRRSWSNRHRREAVRAACKSRGIELVELGPYTLAADAGTQAADLIIAHGATAAIAHNDLTAIGVLLRLADRGVDVPGDVSLIGVDDTILARLSRPSLTSVQIPADEIGMTAVDVLLGLIHHTTRPDVTFPIEISTELVVRDSTGAAPRG